VDGLYLAENILKFLRERTTVLTEQITEGSVPDFATYQKLRSQYEAFVSVEEQIVSLLKKSGNDDEWSDSTRSRSKGR
jgi:hypothetical protein